jgi:hypothetical protein
MNYLPRISKEALKHRRFITNCQDELNWKAIYQLSNCNTNIIRSQIMIKYKRDI